MARLLVEVLDIALAAVIAAVVIGFIRRWRAAAHRVAVKHGKPVTFSAYLRGNVAPYPRRWRGGWLMAGLGPPTWKPSFPAMRQPVTLPLSAEVEHIRRVGLLEGLRTNAECRVIVARAEQVTLELAIPAADVPTVLQALEAASGGGWRPTEGFRE